MNQKTKYQKILTVLDIFSQLAAICHVLTPQYDIQNKDKTNFLINCEALSYGTVEYKYKV